MPTLNFDRPYRVLVETVDADGWPVLIPIETGAVVVPDRHRGVRLDRGDIRVGEILIERDGARTRVVDGELYEPSGGAPTGWATVQGS